MKASAIPGDAPHPAGLATVIELLRAHHGRPRRPRLTDPFQLVVAENAAYLVDDDRRRTVYTRLKREVGTRPAELLAVTRDVLAAVISEDGGMRPDHRAGKLQAAAEIALEIGLTALRRAMDDDPAKALRLLQRFPGIARPGAEKLMLMRGRWRGLAPDSNALRVLLRLGFGREGRDYARSYRAAHEAVEDQLPDDPAWLIEAHQLLRLHGQTLCRNSEPRCAECPLDALCPSAP